MRRLFYKNKEFSSCLWVKSPCMTFQIKYLWQSFCIEWYHFFFINFHLELIACVNRNVLGDVFYIRFLA